MKAADKRSFGKILWSYGKRYELSADGKGLLKYFNSKGDFYHIHSNEMITAERILHRVLAKFRETMQFA